MNRDQTILRYTLESEIGMYIHTYDFKDIREKVGSDNTFIFESQDFSLTYRIEDILIQQKGIIIIDLDENFKLRKFNFKVFASSVENLSDGLIPSNQINSFKCL